MGPENQKIILYFIQHLLQALCKKLLCAASSCVKWHEEVVRCLTGVVQTSPMFPECLRSSRKEDERSEGDGGSFL